MNIVSAAILGIGVVVVILTCSASYLIAVKILNSLREQADVYVRACDAITSAFTGAHTRTLESLDRIHEKNLRFMGEAQDRVMSLDFERFKSFQGTEEMEGGFEPPESEEEPFVQVEVPMPNGRWGIVGAARAQSAAEVLEEQKLLREDFPPGWDEE